MTTASLPPPLVIEQYALDANSVRALSGGLINTSYRVQRNDGTPCTLQRVNPIFSAAVHDDIAAVTRHLDRKGITTPLLIPNADGALCLDVNGEIWRLLTWIDGECVETIATDDQAREAGRVLGSFHAALADFTAPLANTRAGVHDLPRHLQALEASLEMKREHPAHERVAAQATAILELANVLEPLPDMAPRLVHGDPKISNVVFADGRAVCLIDLDTLARMPVALELGDALRSWCNTAAEDSLQSHFSADRFRATLTGYDQGSAGLLDNTERQALPHATLLIAIELAARFAADALNESYFGWDRERFATASDHNCQRAAAQMTLANSIHDQLGELSQLAMTRL